MRKTATIIIFISLMMFVAIDKVNAHDSVDLNIAEVEDKKIDDVSVEGPLPDTPTIMEFNVSEEIENGKLKLIVEWTVEGSEQIEITGIGEKLNPKGKSEVYVTSDTILQILAIGEKGSEAFAKYEVRNVQQKIAYVSGINTNIFLPLLAFIIFVGSISGIQYILSNYLILPVAFLFRGKRKYTGIIMRDEDDKPVPYVKLALLENGKIIMTNVSDAKGRYYFEADGVGEYEIKVIEPGVLADSMKIPTSKAEPIGQDIWVKFDSRASNAQLHELKPDIFKLLSLASLLSIFIGIILAIVLMLQNFNVVYLVVLIIYIGLAFLTVDVGKERD